MLSNFVKQRLVKLDGREVPKAMVFHGKIEAVRVLRSRLRFEKSRLYTITDNKLESWISFGGATSYIINFVSEPLCRKSILFSGMHLAIYNCIHLSYVGKTHPFNPCIARTQWGPLFAALRTWINQIYHSPRHARHARGTVS